MDMKMYAVLKPLTIRPLDKDDVISARSGI